MQARKQRIDVGLGGQVFQQFFRCVVVVMAIGLFSTVAMADSTEADSIETGSTESGSIEYGSTEAGSIEKVNVNQADAQTLAYIPGIGAVKAAAIIELREQNGGFRSFEDLLEVRGIGVKILQDIKAYGILQGGVTEISQEMLDNPPTVMATDFDPNQADDLNSNREQ